MSTQSEINVNEMIDDFCEKWFLGYEPSDLAEIKKDLRKGFGPILKREAEMILMQAASLENGIRLQMIERALHAVLSKGWRP